MTVRKAHGSRQYRSIRPQAGLLVCRGARLTFLSATLTGVNKSKGGSNFQASFGPGRYNVFTCVDFRIVSPEFSPQIVTPLEYGVWSSSGPVRGAVTGADVLKSNHQLLQLV